MMMMIMELLQEHVNLLIETDDVFQMTLAMLELLMIYL